MSGSISTINVLFHGDSLSVINYNGRPYVPMRPVVEGMGLAWQSQLEKLKKRFSKGVTEIVIPSKGGEQSMVCLVLHKLAGWLHTISPNKVKPEIRDKVIRYQEECDDVLYEYWTTGAVKKKLNFRQSTAKELIPLRQTAERLIAHGVGNIYPDIWKHVHAEFGVQHINELLPEQIPLAISYLDALEGEYIPKQEEPNLSEMNVRTLYSHMKHIVSLCKEQVFPPLIMLGAKVETPLRERIETAACLAFALYNDVERKTK